MSNYQYFNRLHTIDSNSFKPSLVKEKVQIKKFEPFGDKKVYLKNIKNMNSIPTKIMKENENEIINAFEKANLESNKTLVKQRDHNLSKNERELRIRSNYKNKLKNDEIAEIEEKLALEKEIINLINYALKFNKKNNALSAMLNNKINEQIQTYAKNNNKGSNSVLNISNLSLNLSYNSTNKSYIKYESNQFLKLLGLDLENLHPDNIKINIDQAINFIKKWKINDKSKIKELIKKKVVAEISSVEERRSVQKVKKINLKIQKLNEAKHFELKNSSKPKRNKLNTTNNYLISNSIGEKTNDSTTQNNTLANNVCINNDYSTKDSKSNQYYTVSTTLDSNKIKTTNYSIHQRDIKKEDKNKVNISISKNQINDYYNKTSTDKEILLNITNENCGIKSKDKSIKSYLKKTKNNQTKPKEKVKLMFDSYKDSKEIFEYIKSNKNLKSNMNLVSHYNNLKDMKDTELLIEEILNKNRIDYNILDNNIDI